MENAKLEKSESPNPLAKMATMASTSGPIRRKCQICSSRYREEAEYRFDKNETIKQIHAFLIEKGEAVTFYKVRYHFESHYRGQMAQIALEEYAHSMEEMTKRRRSTIDDMDHLLAAGWMEFGRYACLQTGGDFAKEQARQKMLSESATMIVKAHEFMIKLHDGETRVKAIEIAFEQTWSKQILEAKTEEEKRMLVATLQDFKSKLQQTKIEA